MFRRFHKEAKHQTWQLLSLCCEVLNVLFIYLFFILILLSTKFKKFIGFYYFSQFIWFVSKLLPTSTSYVRIITGLYWSKASQTRKLRNIYSFFCFTLDFGKKERKRKHLSFHTAQLIAVFLSVLAQEFSKWVWILF